MVFERVQIALAYIGFFLTFIFVCYIVDELYLLPQTQLQAQRTVFHPSKTQGSEALYLLVPRIGELYRCLQSQERRRTRRARILFLQHPVVTSVRRVLGTPHQSIPQEQMPSLSCL